MMFFLVDDIIGLEEIEEEKGKPAKFWSGNNYDYKDPPSSLQISVKILYQGTKLNGWHSCPL